jgi:hypothetical protein
LPAIIDSLRRAGRDEVGDRLVTIAGGEAGRASRLLESILHSGDPDRSQAVSRYLLAEIGPATPRLPCRACRMQHARRPGICNRNRHEVREPDRGAAA